MATRKKTTRKKVVRRRNGASRARGSSNHPEITKTKDPHVYQLAIEAIVPLVITARPRTQIRDTLASLLNKPGLTIRGLTPYVKDARAIIRGNVEEESVEDMVASQAQWYRNMMAEGGDDQARIRAAEGFDRVMALDPKYRTSADLNDEALAERMRAMMGALDESIPESEES